MGSSWQLLPLMTIFGLHQTQDVVMPNQYNGDPTDVSSVHVAPESDDVQILLFERKAANLTPSQDDATSIPFFVDPIVHVAHVMV